MEKRKTIYDMQPDGIRGEEIKRKLNTIKESAIESAWAVVEDPRTFAIAGGVGLWQGLKYKGSFKLGIKAGVSTLSVIVGVSVANGLIEDMYKIKNS